VKAKGSRKDLSVCSR